MVCSDSFNELKASFLFCLLLSRILSSVSNRATFRSSSGAVAEAGARGVGGGGGDGGGDGGGGGGGGGVGSVGGAGRGYVSR